MGRRGRGGGRAAGDGIVVDAYSEKWVRRGFPWVYPKEIAGGRLPDPGEQVVVRAGDGKVLGRGLADSGWIAVRLYRGDTGPLDDLWLFERLDRALALRSAVIDPRTTGHRLVHGENDALPGLRIDRWGDHVTVILDSPAVAPLLDGAVRWLRDRLAPAGVHLCYRPDPRDTRDLSRADPAPGLLHGEVPDGDVPVVERGLTYLVRPHEGPDVGLYTDMREVRAWLEPHWQGRRVLNTFAFTAAFSVAAALHGAEDVLTVDLSRRVLERARDNFRANGLDPESYGFAAEDTFDALERLWGEGERFDLVVVDPPAFSRSRRGVWSAKRDYPKLVAAAARVLRPDGWLLCASNQGEVSPKEFRTWVGTGLSRAGQGGQELQFFQAGPDFPAATWFPEAHYLKVGLWRAL